MDNEQERVVKNPQKAPKTPEFVDTGPDDEKEPAVKCIVMYSTEDEQEPVVKKLQKASKIPKFVDTDPSTEDEQEPAVKKLHKGSKIPKFAAASCTHISRLV